MTPGRGQDTSELLAEQSAYYRAVAEEYERHAIPGAWGGEPVAALDAFAPAGAVLELACGQGSWTRQLLRHADRVTALDGSAEMLAIASSRTRDDRVQFVEADLFEWESDRRYDVVFFGFWLSHVPLERFEQFWSRVAGWLAPTGRVFFVDDAHRTPEELIYGEASEVVQRRCEDGSTYRVVKVPHRPDDLERRLRELGWAIEVSASVRQPFYWGGRRTGVSSTLRSPRVRRMRDDLLRRSEAEDPPAISRMRAHEREVGARVHGRERAALYGPTAPPVRL